MCGIVGAVNRSLDMDAALIALGHRGPDSSGETRVDVAGTPVHLGHTRLAILDLSPAGHQPMTSRDGRWTVSYNGEIYNHLDLRRELPGPFRGHSDTETLVEHIAVHGLDRTVRALNGMFAFAALDRASGELHLVRDPFGIKPLYYRTGAPGELVFASEIRALGPHQGERLEFDPVALQTFLTLRFVPSPATIWKGVHRLAAGHVLTMELAGGAMRTAPFIDPVTDHFGGTVDDAVTQYQELLGNAVERQLLSDVPVGMLLSSGIDSSIVAALAAERGHALRCYTVGFGAEHRESELAGAAETCRVLGLPFVPVEVDADAVIDAVTSVVASLEEPIVSTAALVMWHLVRRAREDVTVVLTGQGSDEPWGGYTRYQNEIGRALNPFTPAWRLAGLTKPLWSRAPDSVVRALRSLPVDDRLDRFVGTYELFDADQRATLTGDSSDGAARSSLEYWSHWLAPADCSPAEEMMRIDTRTCLADDWLLYGDKISMATSLETRVPILDLDVVRFVESLPLDMRIRLGRRKIVHKKMAERYLPESIVNRPKMGFPTPFGTWARGPMRDLVGSVLLDELPATGHFRRAALEDVWATHLAGKKDLTRQVYALFVLGSCHRQLAST